MRLVIDCREPLELINTLENLISTRASDAMTIILDKKALDIGDAIIYFDETDLLNPNKQIIFERKSLSDLIASLKDGRYNEQSYRLDQYPVHNHNIYYIVEGNIERFCKHSRNINNPSLKQTIYSTIFTLSYYKGFSLINSQDIQESANYIYRFIDKLCREKSRVAYYRKGVAPNPQPEEGNTPYLGGNSDVTPYSDCIKTTKKSNITPDNILEIMLLQIPGVCASAAQAIALKFETMKNLIDSLEKNPEALNGIFIKQNKIRALSKTAKVNIFKYILQREQIIKINT